MALITIDLDLLKEQRLTLDQYLVLHHCVFGEFETTEDQWKIFDPERFAETYLELKKPSAPQVMASLRYRKLIEFRSDMSFKVVNDQLFTAPGLAPARNSNIFSSNKRSKKKDEFKGVPLLNRCTDLEIFKSEEFKKMAADFQAMRSEKGDPLTQSKAEKLAKRLIRLSGGNESRAIAILRESWENSWTGIFDLKDRGPGQAIPKKSMMEDYI